MRRPLVLPLVLALGLTPLAVPVAPVLAQEPPTPGATSSPTATADPGVCASIVWGWDTGRGTTGPNQPVTLWAGSDVGTRQPVTRWTLTRTSPGPEEVVRRHEGPHPSWTYAVPQTTTFRLTAVGPAGCGDGAGESTATVVHQVRPGLSLAARREAPRQYAFTGRVVPGRGQAVALYRVAPDGARVLTARTTVRPDGTYRIDRRFLSSGRFAFSVRVAESAAHLAGQSPLRPVTVS